MRIFSTEEIEQAIANESINIQECIRLIADGKADQLNRWSVNRRVNRIIDLCKQLNLFTEQLEDHLWFLADEADISR